MTVRVKELEGLDLDQPVYRIFPLWFFEQSLRLKTLTLVPPSRWEDPFEDVCSNVIMTDERSHQQKQLSDFLTPVYAQCWSFESNSDILIRAYSQVRIDPILKRNRSPASEGVRVQSTSRKIIHALNKAAPNLANFNLYLGKVRYCPSDEVSQFVANGLHAIGPAGMAQPDHRADTLLLKSDYYRHEEELRMLAIKADRQPGPDFLTVPFDPNYVFETVEFDPRLVLFERREREETAKALGFTGRFTGEERAARILFDVRLPNGWDAAVEGNPKDTGTS